MSTTTTTTTTRDRGARYGPMEWAQKDHIAIPVTTDRPVFTHDGISSRRQLKREFLER